MKYYIIAGEASGDLHASNLMNALKELDSKAIFRFWGGDLMSKQGGVLVKHYRDLAFMGFVEVILHLPTIIRNLSYCKKDLLEFKPDVLILIDYPGFNLRIAKFAKQKGFRVVYYISPQIWAWKQSRIKLIKKVVDKMLVILPFEKQFYEKFNMKVVYVGHPLIDAIESKPINNSIVFSNNPIITLMPGSRKQEINTMLPLMVEVSKLFPQFQFCVAAAPSQSNELYQRLTKGSNVKVIYNMTYDLLRQSKAAIVTSGTATLEVALLNVPEVVCYKGSYFSYLIAKRLIKVKYISLVNLVMDAPIVKELIQEALTVRSISEELNTILDPFNHDDIQLKYNELKIKLGGVGASAKAAKQIFLLAQV